MRTSRSTVPSYSAPSTVDGLRFTMSPGVGARIEARSMCWQFVRGFNQETADEPVGSVVGMAVEGVGCFSRVGGGVSAVVAICEFQADLTTEAQFSASVTISLH